MAVGAKLPQDQETSPVKCSAISPTFPPFKLTYKDYLNYFMLGPMSSYITPGTPFRSHTFKQIKKPHSLGPGYLLNRAQGVIWSQGTNEEGGSRI